MLISQDYFVSRMPLYPVSEWLNQANNSELQTFEKIELLLKEKFLKESTFREAIYLASPDLYEQTEKWLINDLKEEQRKKILLSLLKYYTRMSTRCTPYGLFAGCSLGKITKTNNFKFNKKNKFYKFSKLDMNYMSEVSCYISNIPEIKKQLSYKVNSSLYRVADTYQYVEYETINKHREYKLSSIKSNYYLDKIIKFGLKNKLYSDYIKLIIDEDPTIEVSEANNYIELLIKEQILIGELEPTITGEDFSLRFIKKLKKLNGASEITNKLEAINYLTKDKNNFINNCYEIENILNNSFIKTNNKDLIQSDLYFNTSSNEISGELISRVLNDIDKICKIKTEDSVSQLENFKKKFYERYESKAVPMNIVFDNELGIGYTKNTDNLDYSPLLDGLVVNMKSKKIEEWDKYQFKLKAILEESKKSNNYVYQLTKTDIHDLSEPKEEIKDLPSNLFVFGNLLSNSIDKLNSGQYKFNFKTLSGPSSVNILGRYCNGNKEISKKVLESIKEENKDLDNNSIYAEIVHLPESRVGNVLTRPKIREYEIPYLGLSAVSDNKQIQISDLHISIPDGKEIILWSQKLNKRVIPRLTTAHNYRNGLPIYRFLCDLQYQNMQSYFSWNWKYLSNEKFLPRIEYKTLILSRATWNFQEKDLILEGGIVGLINTYVKKYNMPRFVNIVEGDNELALDTNSDVYRNLLESKLLKEKSITLMENLALEPNLYIEDGNQKYCSELIIPVKNISPKNTKEIKKEITRKQIDRTFYVGDEWLYAKIFAGNKTCDQILINVIKPMSDDLLKKGVIKKWFFLRYKDNDNHIRVRFQLVKKKNTGILIDFLNKSCKPYIEKLQISKIQLDTYEREVERYGSYTIENVEQLFYYDSTVVCSLLELIAKKQENRWLIALKGVDCLLDNFNLNQNQKLAYVKVMRDSFYREHASDNKLLIKLNEKYKESLPKIKKMFLEEIDLEESLNASLKILKDRSKDYKLLVNKIRETDMLHKQDLFDNNIIPSIIHLFINRIFTSKQRLYELTIYHFLLKYYDMSIHFKPKQHIRDEDFA